MVWDDKARQALVGASRFLLAPQPLADAKFEKVVPMSETTTTPPPSSIMPLIGAFIVSQLV